MQTAAVASEPDVSRLRLAFAGLAIVLLLVPLAVSAPLVDPDEGLHAAIAQEMVRGHDYVTPTFLGEPFLDKPILFFWAEAFSLRLFGMNEAAVRIPPLVFGLLGMFSVALLARALFDRVTALVAGVAYASMLLPLGVSQVAVHDIGLVPFVCVAMLCLVRATGSAQLWRWSVLAGVSLGLSVLTKGLVGVVFVGMFAVCLAAFNRALLPRIAASLIVAGLVAGVVAAPWYIAMEHAHPGYLYYYFIERHLHGYLTATQRHAGRPWWYYLPILVGGTLPWTGFVAGAIRRRALDERHRILLVIWTWLAIGLVFLSAGESKLVTYVLPLFPGLAIVIAEYVSRAWLEPDRIDNPASRSFRAGLAVQTAVLAALPILAALVIQIRFGGATPVVWGAAIVAASLVSAIGVKAWRAATLDGFMTAATLAISISFVVLAAVMAPRAAEWMTARDLARVLNESAKLPPHVTVLDERIGSLVFYLAPALRAEATPDRISTSSRAATLERLRVDPPDAVLAVREDELARFQRLFQVPPIPQVRAGTFSVYRVDQLRAALGTVR